MPESCLTDDSQPQALASHHHHCCCTYDQTSNPSETNRIQHRRQRTNPNPTHNTHRTSPIMSGAAQGSQNTTKAVVSDSKDTSQPLQPQKPGAQLEEDDEFEDFPVEGTRTRRSRASFRNLEANNARKQTGPRKRKSARRPPRRICGRRAGTTTTRATTFRCS
jgi:hypothetical protein